MRYVGGSKQGALLSDAWEGSSRVDGGQQSSSRAEGIVSVTYLHAGCCRVTHEVFLPQEGRRVFSPREGDGLGSFLIYFDRQAELSCPLVTSFGHLDRSHVEISCISWGGANLTDRHN